MSPQRWQRILELYSLAIEVPESERDGFLRRECHEDENLFLEVQRLFLVSTEEGFLEPPAPLSGAETKRRLGDFRILAELGSGGMGIVYRALQESLGRVVAVKVLPAGFARTQQQIDRFEREARSLAKLRHPNIVSVLTVSREDDTHYFAMEYVEGGNLVEFLNQARASGGDLAQRSPDRAGNYYRFVAQVVQQTADALQAAHEQGIVHRDIKPQNLLLDRSSNVRVVDFGLARDEAMGSLTDDDNRIAGTLQYMSPEQARLSGLRVDHRTDIYSLGIVFYELLTMRKPFEGLSMSELLEGILRFDPPRARRVDPRIPRDLEALCWKAMSKDPALRFSSAGELRDELGRFLAGEAVRTSPPTVLDFAVRWSRTHRARLAVAAALVLTLALGLMARGAYESRRRVRWLEDFLGKVVAGPSLLDRSEPELLQILSILDEYKHLPGQVQAAGPDGISRVLEAEFTGMRSDLASLMNQCTQRYRDTALPMAERERQRSTAVEAWRRGRNLFPATDEFPESFEREAFLPRIHARAFDAAGVPSSAQVFVRALDPVTADFGPVRLLGAGPEVSASLQAGHYRFFLLYESGALREFDRRLGIDVMQIDLDGRLRQDESSIPAGMVSFQQTRFHVPKDFADAYLRGREFDLAAFLIDEAETSNVEYYEFMQATGHAGPPQWALIEDLQAFLRNHGDKPVVGVTFEDAAAYAEFRGKRLPTLLEYLLAALGEEGRPFPYPAGPEEPPRGNVLRPPPDMSELKTALEAYLLYAEPVRSHPEARTDRGLYNVWGNAAELTCSIPVKMRGGVAHPAEDARVFTGGSWDAVSAGEGPRSASFVLNTKDLAPLNVGFRCAKSLHH